MLKGIKLLRSLGLILMITSLIVGAGSIMRIHSVLAFIPVLLATPFFVMGCHYLLLTEEEIIKILMKGGKKK